MKIGERLGLVLVILLVGTVAAMPFWRDEPRGTEPTTSPASDRLLLRVDDEPSPDLPAAPTIVPVPETAATVANKTPLDDVADGKLRSELSGRFVPPTLAPDSLTANSTDGQEAGSDSPRQARLSSPLGETRHGGSPRGHQFASPPPWDRAPQSHRVVDGDSLPALAQRYFGDAGYWRQLMEWNRDRLTHPELLPLGQSLRLRPPEEHPVGLATPPARKPSVVDALGLVPVPTQGG